MRNFVDCVISFSQKLSFVIFAIASMLCILSEFIGVPKTEKILSKIHLCINMNTVIKVGCLFLALFVITTLLMKHKGK